MAATRRKKSEPAGARRTKEPSGGPSPGGGSRLQREIVQSRPFGSVEEEAFLNLLRTAALLEQAFAGRLRPHGLTPTQYNVLRILRGSPGGLPCGEIGRRMVTPVPDVTRLADRLVKAGLAERRRPEEGDRRIVIVAVTDAGLELLAELDERILEWQHELLGHLSRPRLRQLVALLEEARCPVVAEAEE